MLFDRFDNMRSKVINGGGGGGEYDFDLSRIGTPVSCIAQSTITKGNKIHGIKNENYSPELLNESLLIQVRDPSKTSENLDVIINKTSSSVINIYIKTNQNTYTTLIFNLPSDYTSFGDICINEDGTLACIGLNQSSNVPAIAMLEINKEEQTFNPYYFNDFSQFFASTTFISIRKNVLCSSSQHSGNSSIAKNIPVYDKESHSFTKFDLIGSNIYGGYMFNGTNQQTDFAGCGYATWNNDSTLLVCSAHLLGNPATIYKFDFNWTGHTINGSSVTIKSSGNYQTNVFNNGNIVAIGIWNSTNSRFNSWEIYSFNPSTLTYSLVYTFSNYSIGLIIINNKMIVNDTSGHIFLYDITDFSNVVQLDSITDSTLYFGLYFINRRLIGNPKYTNIISATSSSSSSMCTKKIIIFESGTAEFIINSTNLNDVESNKIYGIASKSLSTGEIGNEQLLWSTITSP